MCRTAGLRAFELDAADLPGAASNASNWPAPSPARRRSNLQAVLVRTDRLENAALLDAWLRRVEAPVAVDVELAPPPTASTVIASPRPR